MKHIIIFPIVMLVMLFSSSAMAEWAKIDDFVGDGRNVFVDIDSAERNGDRVTMWTLTNYAGPREVSNKEHMSTKTLEEYDCNNEQYRTLSIYWFSEHDAEGDVFYEETAPGKMKAILPDTNYSEARKIACAHR